MKDDKKFKYKYTEQKQAILKKVNGNFNIITQFGKELEVTLEQILVYLFCNNQDEIEEIQNRIKENYKDFLISEEYIKNILEFFQEKDFVSLEKDKRDFHPIYSFNPFKVVKKLDIKCNKDTIISLGKLEIEITNNCPFTCSYCMRRINSQNECVNFERKRKLVYECFEMGAYSLNITGGEPLFGDAAQETIELVKYAKKLGYKRIMVSSSGFGIKDNINKLVNAGLNEVQISYNKCELYEEDRLRNKFVEDNIEDITQVMEYGIRLGVCCVLTKESIGKIKEIIEFCIKHKIYSIYFYPVMPVGGAVRIWDSIKIDTKLLIDIINKIKEYKEIYKDKIFISAPQSFLQKKDEILQICEGGTYMIYVSNKGEVSSCACCTQAVENIKNMDVEAIWKNSKYFDKYRIAKKYKEPCSECYDIVYCLNSCVVREEQAFTLGLKYECKDCKLKSNIPEILNC